MRLGIGIGAYVRRRSIPPGTVPPANTVAPAVTGDTAVGSELTTTDGTWDGDPAPTFTYRWRRDGVAIAGAAANTYTTVLADLGAAVTCRVTATNVAGSAGATSNAITVTSADEAPANTAAPVVSGATAVGSTLATTDGTWTGSPAPTFTYQWQRGGVDIGGATSDTYATVEADIGSAVTCVVTATNTAGSASASSNAITPTAVAPANTAAPVASGTVAVGGTLSCTTGTWTGTPAPTYAYQWRRAGADIGGATASAYTPVAADIGPAIDCVVTATNAAGSASQDSNDLLSPELWAADFTTLAVGAAATLPAGLLLARASVATVQTGTATVDATIAADTARIGKRLDAHASELVLEHGATNLVPHSHDLTAATFATSGTVTVTADYAVGPGGTAIADRVETTSGSGGKYRAASGLGTARHVWSVWTRNTSGAGAVQIRMAGNTDSWAWNASNPGTFERLQCHDAPFSGTANCFVAEGRAGPSLAAGAKDNVVAYVQLEPGYFATEGIMTTGVAAARAGERLYHPAVETRRDGAHFAVSYKFRPKGSSAQYTAAMRLWTLDASNYAEVSHATAAVTVVVAGTAYTTPVAMTWAAHDLVELFVEVASGAPVYVAYRVNGGTRTVLSTGSPPTLALGTPTGAFDLLCNGTAGQFTARHEDVRGWRSTTRPAWAA